MFSPWESVCHHGKTLFEAGTSIETPLRSLPGVYVFVCLWKDSVCQYGSITTVQGTVTKPHRGRHIQIGRGRTHGYWTLMGMWTCRRVWWVNTLQDGLEGMFTYLDLCLQGRLVRFKHKNTKLGGVMTNKLSNIYSFIASNTENTLMSL